MTTEQITPLSEKRKTGNTDIPEQCISFDDISEDLFLSKDVKQALKNFCEEVGKRIDDVLEKKTGKYTERSDDGVTRTLFADTIFYRKDLIMREIKNVTDEAKLKHFGEGML